MTIIRPISVGWGAADLAEVLAVTVKDQNNSVLIERTTGGFTPIQDGSGQYLLLIPNWDLSWGALTYVDDGQSGISHEKAVWLDPPLYGPGPGVVGVNQDTGGTNNLQFVYNGVGVVGATILAYLVTDYESGNFTNVIGASITGLNGDWMRPIFLPTGYTYTIAFSKIGQFETSTMNISV